MSIILLQQHRPSPQGNNPENHLNTAVANNGAENVVEIKNVVDILSLTAEERQRSVGQGQAQTGDIYQWRLPRGTVLQPQDCLGTALGDRWVRIQAQEEPVFVVTTADHLLLLKVAYHLGNRHIPLEIQKNSLRLGRDPVLLHLLQDHLQVTVTEALVPFFPEVGAYHRHD
jgi:urease accessory protein